MKYIGKKISGLIIALLIVTMAAFAAFEVIPGDPARTILGTEATDESVMALREEMGLNRPLPQRYLEWVKDFVSGDMGTSYFYNMPVKQMIGDKIPITVTLALMAFVFILLISIPVSILSVKYKDGFIDRFFLVLNQVTMSIPPFFIGIIFTFIFGLTFKMFIPGGYVSYKEDFGAFVGYLIFPAIAIALPKAAMTTKLLRNSLLTEMRQDYVRTARSRGNSEARVLFVHVFKNGLLPVITFLGMVAADLVANSIVIEQVFGIPGLGRTLISSISKRDYPVVEAIIVLVAIVVLVVNVLVDIIYRKLDKRIEI